MAEPIRGRSDADGLASALNRCDIRLVLDRHEYWTPEDGVAIAELVSALVRLEAGAKSATRSSSTAQFLATGVARVRVLIERNADPLRVVTVGSGVLVRRTAVLVHGDGVYACLVQDRGPRGEATTWLRDPQRHRQDLGLWAVAGLAKEPGSISLVAGHGRDREVTTIDLLGQVAAVTFGSQVSVVAAREVRQMVEQFVVNHLGIAG